MCLNDRFLSYYCYCVFVAAILENGGYNPSDTFAEVAPSKSIFLVFLRFQLYITVHPITKTATGHYFHTLSHRTIVTQAE